MINRQFLTVAGKRIARQNASLAKHARRQLTYARQHSITTQRPTRPVRPLCGRNFGTTAPAKLATIDESFDPSQYGERTEDEVDLCIVGGGPAGLSAAIRFKQLADEAGKEYRVIVLEKAPDMGSHILSGAVIEPRALKELFPDWDAQEDRPANMEPVAYDKMKFLTSSATIPIPAPPQMHNKGNYIVELSSVTRWLAEKAEAMGIELYPGFGGADVIYSEDGASVRGVATSDVGMMRDEKPGDEFERGMAFHARTTLFAEGAHGSLTKKLVKKFDLRKDSQPQSYGLGLKEVWEVPDKNFRRGEVSHSLGFPLKNDTYGGGWMYHYGDNLVSVGLVVGLDYPNPWLNPYMEFQKMKHHPHYASVLEGGKCLSYGARALNEGGFQSIPKLTFPGGALIGCTAGFLNVPKIKGTHTAMKSGMLAAEAAFEAFEKQGEVGDEVEAAPIELEAYTEKIQNSWVWSELKEVRNVRPSFHNPLGNWGGILYSGIETLVLRGKSPWTLKHPGPDAYQTKHADQCEKLEYPKPDGKLSFDLLTNLARTGTYHEENIPVHLRVKDWDKHTEAAYPAYKGIETRFCPAGVYEYNEDPSQPLGVKFNINSQNCIHCKTCDIKVPTQDIDWQIPTVSGGPKYAY